MFPWITSSPEHTHYFSCYVTSRKDDLENSVLIATSKTVIISLELSPSCCFTLLTHTALHIHIVVRSESRCAEPHHNLYLLIFTVVWSACLLACFHLKPGLFLDCIPFLQIYIKLLTLLPAPGENRLCYKSHLPLKYISTFIVLSKCLGICSLSPQLKKKPNQKTTKPNQIANNKASWNDNNFLIFCCSIYYSLCVWFWHSSPWSPYFRFPEIKFCNNFNRFLVEWKFRSPFR